MQLMTWTSAQDMSSYLSSCIPPRSSLSPTIKRENLKMDLDVEDMAL